MDIFQTKKYEIEGADANGGKWAPVGIYALHDHAAIREASNFVHANRYDYATAELLCYADNGQSSRVVYRFVDGEGRDPHRSMVGRRGS